MARKKSLGSTADLVRKESSEGDKDIRNKREVGEKRLQDLEAILDTMSDLRGGVNDAQTEAARKEMQQAHDTQQRKHADAVKDTKKKEKNLEGRIEKLAEAQDDKEQDSSDAKNLAGSLNTDFSKKFISKIEQDSRTEAKDYQQQKEGLEATVKEVKQQMDEQQRRAKRQPKFNI